MTDLQTRALLIALYRILDTLGALLALYVNRYGWDSNARDAQRRQGIAYAAFTRFTETTGNDVERIKNSI